LISDPVPGPNDRPPPNGTIFDRLSHYGLSWKDYFTDLPQAFLVPSVATSHPLHLAPVAEFFIDAAAGTLPAVAFVDPDFGLADVIGEHVPGDVIPPSARAQGADEENPQNIRLGEAFASSVISAVINSPAWKRTLLIWFYDEHGGYYDHVRPPPALAPDHIKPDLGASTVHAGFNSYGPRVPAVVVSPWSRPHSVTNVVHDHTSVLAFIEQKWNLPAMTMRDANANSLLDFLDLRRPHLLDPPALTPPADPVTADLKCDTSLPHRPVVTVPTKHRRHSSGPTSPRPINQPRPTAPTATAPRPAAPGGEQLPNTGGEPLAIPGLTAATLAAATAAVRRIGKEHGPAEPA
jgi:phospholipase C